MVTVKPDNRSKICEKLGEETLELEFSEEKILEELFLITEILSHTCSWGRNIQIKNKNKELERLEEHRINDEDFKPRFEFKDFDHDPSLLLNAIEKSRSASKKIREKNVRKTGFETIKAQDLKTFFAEIFDEFELYVKLAHKIEDENSWKNYSKKIWSKPSEKGYRESLKALEKLEPEKYEENISPEELAEMFQKELKRLDVDYGVEVRPVSGCHNIPEEETVVVAEGENGERKYSEPEAKMLTKHEIFHVIRGINGRKFSSSFPFLGVHTPFYDKTEEGGAVLRERKTQTNYESKDFDYHLRRVAAYKLSRTENFEEDFQTLVEELIELGGSFERSFYLLARNREALRHHIYLSGMNDWKEENLEKLLIGKVNPKWAEKFWMEVEGNGKFQKPFIGPEKLFESE